MGRRMGILAASVAVIAATPAMAQDAPAVALVAGDALSIAIDAQARVTGREQGRAPSQLEGRVMDLFEAENAPAAMGPNTADITAVDIEREPIAPGRLSARFFVRPGKGSLLVLANGYDKAVAYRARITVKGKATATDVCTVLPGKRQFESWPYAIEKIEMSSVVLESWDGGRPRCE